MLNGDASAGCLFQKELPSLSYRMEGVLEYGRLQAASCVASETQVKRHASGLKSNHLLVPESGGGIFGPEGRSG